MNVSPNSEKVTTELGAIAVCVTSTVGFMLGAAYARALFTIPEWWGFFLCGMLWLSVVTGYFLPLHRMGFMWREHRLLAATNQGMAESYTQSVNVLAAIIERLNTLSKQVVVGPELLNNTAVTAIKENDDPPCNEADQKP